MSDHEVFFRSLHLKFTEWMEQEKRGENPFAPIPTSTALTSGGFERILRGEDKQALDRIEEGGPLESKGTLYAMLFLPSLKEIPSLPVREFCREEILGMFGSHPDLRICPQCGKLFDMKATGRRKFCSPKCYRRNNRPDDKTDRRRAYRRVRQQFKRMVDERGEAESTAKQYLKTTEPWGSLIKQYNLNMDSWKGDHDG